MTDLTEHDIARAIERCDDGTAGGAERSIAAAAMVRAAYSYAGMEPRSFSRWLKMIASDMERELDRSATRQ